MITVELRRELETLRETYPVAKELGDTPVMKLITERAEEIKKKLARYEEIMTTPIKCMCERCE